MIISVVVCVCTIMLFASVCVCLTFLFCSRIMFLTKTEKVEPVQNLFKTQKQRTVAKAIDRQEAINRLLENG